jgi:hypothetical protein
MSFCFLHFSVYYAKCWNFVKSTPLAMVISTPDIVSEYKFHVKI